MVRSEPRELSLIGLALTSVLTFTGCAGEHFNVKVSGLKDPQAPVKTSYVLRPTKNVRDTDLEFREFSAYTVRALVARGFVQTDDKTAEVVIFLDYGVGPPKTTYSVTGGFGGPELDADTSFFRWARLEAVDAPAYFNAQKVVELWRTTMMSEGTTGDLRRVFPILIAAGEKYFGVDTGRAVLRVMTDDDAEVLAVRDRAR